MYNRIILYRAAKKNPDSNGSGRSHNTIPGKLLIILDMDNQLLRKRQISSILQIGVSVDSQHDVAQWKQKPATKKQLNP